MEIAGIKFTESKQYYYFNGDVYYRSAAGEQKEKWHIHRKIGKYKLHSEHFNSALPYTVYYLIDTENEKIYKSKDCYISMIDKIVNELK